MFRLIRSMISFAMLCVLILGVYFYVARVTTLEHYLSKRLGTRVWIEAVDLSWQKVTVKKFRMENLGRSNYQYAFEAKEIYLEMNLVDLWNKKIHLTRLHVEEPYMAVELYNVSGSDNNWARILNNMPQTTSDTTGYYVIDSLKVQKLKIDATKVDGKTFSIPTMPVLEFRNLGSEHPLTLAEVGKIVFFSVLRSLRPQLGELLQSVSTQLSDKIWQDSSTSFERLKESTKEGREAIKKRAEEAKEFLHDLFSH